MFYILSARFSNHMVYVLIHITENLRTFSTLFEEVKIHTWG